MSVIGGFPLAADIKRRTIRAPVNPLDKSTVVSILPKHILERKCTIQPGVFEIKPGSYEVPSLLVVGPSSWWKEIDDHQPILEIPQSSIQIADSICRDYCNGILACDMGDNMPGLFYIPGAIDIQKLRKDHQPQLEAANIKQRNWFTALVRMADALWARSNGNPLSISDDMKMAARHLNLINKEWLKDSQTMELVRCIACGHLGNPAFPVCANCKAVTNKELAEKLGLTFVR